MVLFSYNRMVVTCRLVKDLSEYNVVDVISIKLSGESIFPRGNSIEKSYKQLKKFFASFLHEEPERIVVTVGGGGFFRGRELEKLGTPPEIGHRAGMTATLTSAVFLRSVLSSLSFKLAVHVVAPTAWPIGEIYGEEDLPNLLAHKTDYPTILILAGGSGLPFLSTDTVAVIRTLQSGGKRLIKFTQVDGIYPADPKKEHFSEHAKIRRMNATEYLSKDLKVIDGNAVALARQEGVEIDVASFDLALRLGAGEAIRRGSAILPR